MSEGARRGQPVAALHGVSELRMQALEDRPVERWPTDAILLALRSANPDVWRRVTAAVNRDPYGRTAHQVAELMRAGDVRESIPAIAEVVADARARLEAAERSEVTQVVHVLLKRSSLNEHEFAMRIGVSDPELAAYLDGNRCPSAVLMVRMKALADRFAKAKESAQRRAQ